MSYLLRFKKIIFGIMIFISVCAVQTVYDSIPVFADEITTVPDGGIDKGGDNIFTNIRDTVNTLFATIKGATNAVVQTYNQIKSFRDVIKNMISTMSSGSSGSETGVPVTEAIGTIRYCIGDNLFYPTKIISDLMGHAEIRTTEKFYIISSGNDITYLRDMIQNALKVR